MKFMFAFGIVRLIVVSSPDMWKLQKLPKGKWYYMLNVLFGDNLITMNDASHRNHRQVMSHFTSRSVLHATLPSLNHHANRLVDEWRKHPHIELEEWMTRVTFDIICDQAFGFEANCIGSNPEGVRFSESCRRIASGVMKHYLHAPFAAKLWKFLHHGLYSEVDAKIHHCIAARRAERAKRQPADDKPRDLLDLMLDASVKGNGWSDQELRDECFILFLAGHETTAETLTWLLTHIAADKDLQAKLRAEVRQQVGGVTKDNLDMYPELTKVCKEGLRMYPPAFMITRFGRDEVEIDGCPIPKGYDMMLNLIGLQRSPQAYKSADTFNPERWNDPACGEGGFFAPFSLGPRQCLGMNFFWIEAKAVLSALLSNFELHTDHIPDWGTLKISTQPVEHIKVLLKPLS